MIEVKLTFSNEQELLAFFTRTAGVPVQVVAATTDSVKSAPVKAQKPTVQEAPKHAPEPVKEVAPAVSPTPAPAAPTEPPPAPAPAPQAAAPAPAAPAVKYEDSGIPSLVPTYLKPGSDGYDTRRAALVALLTKYGVASAKTLPPEQFEPFKADLAAL